MVKLISPAKTIINPGTIIVDGSEIKCDSRFKRLNMQKSAICSFLLASLVGIASQAQDKGEVPLTFGEYKNTVNSVNIKDHTITLEKFEKLRGKPDLVVLDLRSEHEYNQGHIKGALPFGADISKERLEKLVPNKKATIVIYCTNNIFPSRRISLNFASLPQIIDAGYTQSFVLEELYHNGFDAVDEFKKGPFWQEGAAR